ncbi:hypothetical protein [Amycolatopsis sp. NPDC003731]
MPPRRKAGFAVAAVVVAVLVVLCVGFAPSWLVGHAPGLGAADRLKAVNDVRATLLQALGGLLALAGVGLGAGLTSRQLSARSRSRPGRAPSTRWNSWRSSIPATAGTSTRCSPRSSAPGHRGGAKRRRVAKAARPTTWRPRSRHWAVAG